MNWAAKFVASQELQDDLTKLILKGVCIDSSVNRNGWQVPDDQLDDVAEKSIGVLVHLDHSHGVRDVKGRITNAWVDEPHTEQKESYDPPNEYRHVHFEAEVATNDKNLLIPLLNGYVDHVSIGTRTENVTCSVCGKDAQPKKCKCDGWLVTKDIDILEYSIVAIPAYKSAVFETFVAGLEMPEEKITYVAGNVINNYGYSDKVDYNACCGNKEAGEKPDEEEVKNAEEDEEEEGKTAALEKEEVKEASETKVEDVSEEEKKEASEKEDEEEDEEDKKLNAKLDDLINAINNLADKNATLVAKLEEIGNDGEDGGEGGDGGEGDGGSGGNGGGEGDGGSGGNGGGSGGKGGFQAAVVSATVVDAKATVDDAVKELFTAAARFGIYPINR